MAKRKEALHWIDHPDDVFYDEAKIVTVERYKTSGLSGDEWRFSYKVELYRKGQLVAWTQVGSFEYAALQLLRATMLALVELEGDEHWETIDHRELRREGFRTGSFAKNTSSAGIAALTTPTRTTSVSKVKTGPVRW